MNNTVILIGRLTKEPELRATANGTDCTRINLAISRSYKNSNGEYETDFPQITLYNQLAKNICEYCHKGDLIAIRGMVQTGSYEKDGKRIFTQEIIADKVSFLSTSTKKEETQKVDTKEVSTAENNVDPFAQFQEQNREEINNLDFELPF